jgi:hypothetical protein
MWTLLVGIASTERMTKEVRRRCGKELLRRGMFPPRKYFTSLD